MQKLFNFFLVNKVVSVIIGIIFMILAAFIHQSSFIINILFLSNVLPIIFFTLGFSFFRIALSNPPDSSLKITILKSFILLCGIMFMSSILDVIKISANSLLRSIVIVITAFSLLSVLGTKK